MMQNSIPLRRAYHTGHRDPVEAFEAAIESGRLSADRAAQNYAGAYMYMGTVAGIDQFKHIDTRRYLPQLAVGVAAMVASTTACAHLAHDMHAHTVDEAGTFIILAVVFLIVGLPCIVQLIADRINKR